MDNLKFNQTVGAILNKLRQPEQSKFKPKGRFRVEHRDIDGKLKGIYEFNNDIVNVGKNDILGVYFSGGTATGSSSWVIGLISNSGYSALAAADTMGSHTGWTEFTTYSQSNRVQWGPGSASSQSVTNASPATFDITGSGTIKGIFVCNQNTKGGTTGILWATALFSADVPVTNGDQLKVTYTVNA